MFKEKHHIVFKKQGGLDMEVNYIYLNSEDHRGNNGPHKSRERDLELKCEMERELREILDGEYFTEEKLMYLLGIDANTAYKAFRKVYKTRQGMSKEDVIFRLMGGKFYL